MALAVWADASEILPGFPCEQKGAIIASKQGKGMKGNDSHIFTFFTTLLSLLKYLLKSDCQDPVMW